MFPRSPTTPSPGLVVHALVTSWLDHINEFCMGLPMKTTQRLELGQYTEARLLVKCCTKAVHYWL